MSDLTSGIIHIKDYMEYSRRARHTKEQFIATTT